MMTEQQIIDTMVFLNRVTLTGKEVPVFNSVMQGLIDQRNEMLPKKKEEKTDK